MITVAKVDPVSVTVAWIFFCLFLSTVQYCFVVNLKVFVSFIFPLMILPLFVLS